jgi:high affinity Mn2+ porin
MPTVRTAPQYLAITTLLAAIQSAAPAEADDGRGRGGFYAGGHVGYMFGTANATFGDPTSNVSGGIASAGGPNPYGALFGGLQGGYEYVFPSRLMLGIEADFSFPNYEDASKVLSYRATGTGYASEEYEWIATLRGRLGYDIGAWTPFVTGGIAWASTRFSRIDLTTGNEDANPSNIRLGYALGGGVDYRLDQRWSARAEYLYTNLGLTGFTFASAPARYDSQYDLHRFRVGLNYHFGGNNDAKEKPDDRGPGTWEIHGQTAFVYQGYPPISAAYDGTNSLPAVGQSRETWAISGFLGVRLWQGGEFYYNPELLQGYGVALSAGAGGFPNGEAQRAFPYPRYNTSRLFLRQTLGLGGEREKVDSDLTQLAGERDISRVTVQVGKFAVQDLFDNNAYANDPRVDFLNWSIWAAGAFDYPADSVGYTWGAVAELNQPNWAVRAGYFLVANQPDTNVYDLALISRSGVVGELELRYTPYGRAGTTRLGSWLTHAYAGSYNDAVALAAISPGLNANDTIPLTRQGRTKYGFYFSIDQELSDDIGAFARFSWNDGRSEILAFTDIDTSLSAGLSIKGSTWGRPDDVVGIAGALNSISGDHANYLAAGGLGLTVGDGALTYASEGVVEAYYALRLAKGITVTADYQFLANPAYNAVRGPAHFFSGRLMAKF